jgi:methylase of polypeptide subunit release factors
MQPVEKLFNIANPPQVINPIFERVTSIPWFKPMKTFFVTKISSGDEIILFNPPYEVEKDKSYAVREMEHDYELWEVEESGSHYIWAREAHRKQD